MHAQYDDLKSGIANIAERQCSIISTPPFPNLPVVRKNASNVAVEI